MRVWRMRTGISITITASQRRQLKAFVGDRNAPQKHDPCPPDMLLSADRVGTFEIMHRTGRSKTCVWRWGQRSIAIFSCDMDSIDFTMRKPEQVIRSVMTKLAKHGKGIILMHDFQRATAEAFPSCSTSSKRMDTRS